MTDDELDATIAVLERDLEHWIWFPEHGASAEFYRRRLSALYAEKRKRREQAESDTTNEPRV